MDQITGLNLLKIEKEYDLLLKQIFTTKAFLLQQWTLTEAQARSDINDEILLNLDDNDTLVIEYKEQNKRLLDLVKSLEHARKSLFENFTIDIIPLNKISNFESFLSEYQKNSHDWNNKQENQLTPNMSVRELWLSVSVKNCLISVNINTLQNIIKLYNEQWISWFTSIRNFWKKNSTELTNFLKEHKLVL